MLLSERCGACSAEALSCIEGHLVLLWLGLHGPALREPAASYLMRPRSQGLLGKHSVAPLDI
eukprot:10452-Amphidinium_carterae.1